MGEFFADQGLFVYSKLCNRKVPHSSQLGTGGYDDLRYIRSLERDYDTVWGSMIKQTIRRVYPGFNEVYYGVNSFAELLEQVAKEGHVELEYDETRGNYMVRSRRG